MCRHSGNVDAAGLEEGLAVVARFETRELVDVRLHQVREPPEECAAIAGA
jgi:hypothetical protein